MPSRAAEESLDQHRLAAAAAAIMAVAPAPGLVLDALTMFGAIGYTWEHDLNLYWRRATSLAASIGSTTLWTRRLGELTRRIARDFSLNLGDAEADFRTQVGDILDSALSLSNDGVGRQDDSEEFATGPRRTLIADAGLVVPQWPAPWGRGATPLQQLIVADEFAKRPELIQPSVGIAEWILPTMLRAGSDTLRERFVARTLRGELAWCQLFSEPGAGSDLASLITRATRVDGGWLINGHKIWTSFAHRADFGALLARTDPAAPKHRGIGYFIIDMRSEGLKIFPIRQTTGRAEFNEVFFADVFVPDDMVLGDPTAGWDWRSIPWPKNGLCTAVTSTSTGLACSDASPKTPAPATARCCRRSARSTHIPTRSKPLVFARLSSWWTAKVRGPRPASPRSAPV
jgi:alkylation response protein AidB-like acyl-CoA dehydrogenase